MAPQLSEWSTLKSANLTELEPTNAVHQPRLLKSGLPTEKFAIRYAQAHRGGLELRNGGLFSRD